MKSEARQVRREAMLDHMKRWAGSGKSRLVYCQEANLALSVFNYWHSKFRKEQSAPSQFVALHPDGGIGGESGIELYYPNGVRLVWRGESNPGVIKMLISLY